MKKLKPYLKTTLDFAYRYYLYIIFLISAVGMFGSLYLSDIAGYEACSLCYVQRYFLYPIVFLAAFEIAVKKNIIKPIYLLTLSTFGVGVAIYHNFIQLLQVETEFCVAGGVSCAKVDPVNILGIDFSIPFMSLVAFLFISALLVFVIWRKNKGE